MGALRTARSWEMLHDPTMSGDLTAEQFYDLCRDAGYDEATSQRAASQRALERVRQDKPP